MQKVSQKKRELFIKQSKRAMRKLSKAKKSRSGHHAMPMELRHDHESQLQGRGRRHTVKAPAVLSLIDNTEETLGYFDEIFQVAKRCALNDKIYFDLSAITKITAESVMYIIALIRNIKRTKLLKVGCEGNFPTESSARSVIEKVGFYRYVRTTTHKLLMDDTSQIQISEGLLADVELSQKICDFVQRYTNTDRCGTKKLYRMIMEMMTNTKEHAYSGSSNGMIGNWYIYVEDTPQSVHFVFLDTGAGIPSTVRKNFGEKIKGLVRSDDGYYIRSALEGGFRTATKETYRGKGLPEIYEHVTNGIVTDFQIFSGRGLCSVLSDGQIQDVENKIEFRGTLFMWNCPKTALQEVI